MEIEDIEDLNGNFTSLDCIEHDVDDAASGESIKKPNYNELIKQIMPQHPERLFSQILYTKDMDNVIFKWQNEFHLTQELAIHDLYQLYVDICTYQHINVKTFLEIQGNYLHELVPYMDNSRNSILSYTGKYFLSIRNKAHLKNIAKIEEFIEKFVAASFKAKIVYDNCLFQKLIKFFMLLCASNKRPTRHTGVFLGVKHLTELIRVGAKICHKICNTQSALESVEDPEMIEELNSKLENLKNFDDQVNLFISVLKCHIFKENVNYQEPTLHFMRLELILELYKWIEIYPGRHLQDENLSYFVKAMTDRNKIVRGTAVDMIGKIIVNYDTLVQSKLHKLMFPIAKQIEDVDLGVAIKAVDTLTIIQRYLSLPSNIREILLKNIYNVNFPLAEASGRYLVSLIQQKSNDNDGDGEDQLKHLLMFEFKAVKRGLVERQPYLIESIYNYCPFLQDVKIFIKLFNSTELNEEYKDIWLNLLTESVHITFTGKCSEKRNKQETRKIDKEVQNKMQNDLINSLNMLLDNWSKEQLVPLLELLRDKIREGKKNTTTRNENVTKRTTRSKNKTKTVANENNTGAAEELDEPIESPTKQQKT